MGTYEDFIDPPALLVAVPSTAFAKAADAASFGLSCVLREQGMQFGGRWITGVGKASPPLNISLNLVTNKWCERACEFHGTVVTVGRNLLLGSVGDPALPPGWVQAGSINLDTWAYTNLLRDRDGPVGRLVYECAPTPE